MSALAPTIQAFFTDRLAAQRDASPRTITAYRNALRLLLVFASDRTGSAPSQLDIADLDAALIGAFLTHLEIERGNSVATRNARLAAIRALFAYAALRHPEHAEVIQRVLAIPTKRDSRPDVCFLTLQRSTRCSPPPTAPPGTAAATTPCSCSTSKPACASPSSPACE